MRYATLLGVVALVGCGGGENDGDQDAAAGSIVYNFVATFGDSIEEAIYVFDVATESVRFFRADEDIEGGVGVAGNGAIAQLGELDDAVRITVTQSTGALVTSFTVEEDLSFATSGAAISPDASLVAFSLDVDFGETRGPRTYLCDVAPPHRCTTFDGVDGPSFAPDGRLLAVDEEGTGIYVSNVARTLFTRLDTPTLEAAENPVMTRDGRYVIFDSGFFSHLDILDTTTGLIRPLTRDGISQFRAALSPDERYLLFEQKCCGGEISIPTLYRVPFDPTATVSAAYADLSPLVDASDDPIAVSGRAGWYAQ